MNKETLESIKETVNQFRADILRGNYDIRSILMCILTFMDEQISYELDKLSTANSYT